MPSFRLTLLPFVALVFLQAVSAAFVAQNIGSGTITGRVFNQGTGQFLCAAIVAIPGVKGV